MNNLIPFSFEGGNIRVVQIDGEPWFVGKDVAAALGYVDPTTAIRSHCKGVQKRHPLQTAGGMQEVRILSEPDVLRLIVSSKLPAAVRFERWVFEQVLPSIRKTGIYSGGQEAAALKALNDPSAMRGLLLVYTEKVIALEGKVAEQEETVVAFRRIADADGSLTLREAAKALQMPERKLAQWMHEKEWLFRSPRGGWMGYAEKTKAGFLTHKVHPYFDEKAHEDKVRHQVRITSSGLAKLAKMLGVELEEECDAG